MRTWCYECKRLKEYHVIFSFTLEQIIVLNTYCNYNTPIPKYDYHMSKHYRTWDTKKT